MTGDTGLNHEFLHNALVQLASASNVLASARGLGADPSMQRKGDFVKGEADAITRDPEVTTHGDDIRSAAIDITGMISQIQDNAYPGLGGAVKDLEAEAEVIQSFDLTLDQKQDVRSFFGSARVTLDAMQDYDRENNRG